MNSTFKKLVLASLALLLASGSAFGMRFSYSNPEKVELINHTVFSFAVQEVDLVRWAEGVRSKIVGAQRPYMRWTSISQKTIQDGCKVSSYKKFDERSSDWIFDLFFVEKGIPTYLVSLTRSGKYRVNFYHSKIAKPALILEKEYRGKYFAVANIVYCQAEEKWKGIPLQNGAYACVRRGQNS